jgi:hypothetical protein
MNFDYGTWIAIGAALLFYLRLIILQRQKAKQIRQPAQPGGRGGRGQKSASSAPVRAPTLTLNKPLVISGAVLMLGGAALAGLPGIDAALSTFWWLPVTAGIALMGLGFR